MAFDEWLDVGVLNFVILSIHLINSCCFIDRFAMLHILQHGTTLPYS